MTNTAGFDAVTEQLMEQPRWDVSDLDRSISIMRRLGPDA